MRIIIGPTVQFGLDLQYSALGPIQGQLRIVGIHRRAPGIPASSTANLLAPFAMCPPLACSDYYGASAPSRAFGRRRAYPTVQLDAGRRERHETVPVFDSESIDQLGTQLCPGSIATTTPQTFIVAGLLADTPSRLRSRPLQHSQGTVVHCIPAHIRQI